MKGGFPVPPKAVGDSPHETAVKTLCRRLLARAGKRFQRFDLVVQELSPFLVDWLLNDGRFLSNRRLEMRPGKVNGCHDNARRIVKANHDRYLLWTGLALGYDGIWRSHSWAYDLKTGTIIETTVKAKLYFGSPLPFLI